MLAWTEGYTTSDSGLVGRSHSNGVVEEVPTFESILSAEIDVKIHLNGKVCSWASIFVMVQLLGIALCKNPNFVL